MLKKFKIQLLFIEIAFVLLFTTGLKRLYLSSQMDIYDAIIQQDDKKFESLTDLTFGEVLHHQYLYALLFWGISVLIILFINWRSKTHFIYSILVFIISFSFFPLGLINGKYLPVLFNSFCFLFSDDGKVAYIIGGIIINITSFTILLSKNIKKNRNVIG